MKEFLRKYASLKKFLGPNVWFLYKCSALVGFFWFCVEASFVYIFQAFLVSLKLVDPTDTFLPNWILMDSSLVTTFLVIYGGVRGIAIMAKTYISGITNQAFVRNMRERVLSIGLKRAGVETTHFAVSMFTEKINQSGAVLLNLSVLSVSLTSVILLFFFGIYIAYKEFLISIFLLSLVLFPLRAISKYIRESGKGLVGEYENASEVLIQGFKNNFFLKIYGLIEKEIERGANFIRSYETHYRKYYVYSALRKGVPIMGGVWIVSLTAYLSQSFFSTTPMKLVSLFYLLIRFAQGLSEVNHTFSEVKLHFASLRELYAWVQNIKLIEAKDRENQKEEGSLELGDEIEITSNDIEFGYPEGENILNKISFSLKVGDCFIIKGQSGSGKSTLVSLLAGTLRPSSGSLQVNGQEISAVRNQWSKKIGYVGPEPYLISGSIRENLSYGNDFKEIKDEDMWNALAEARVKPLVDGFPKGLDEELWEHAQVSTGQKQRLALARVFLRNPKVIFLDEATANLDDETEEDIIEILRRKQSEKIFVVISHKRSFDAMASDVLQLP